VISLSLKGASDVVLFGRVECLGRGVRWEDGDGGMRAVEQRGIKGRCELQHAHGV